MNQNYNEDLMRQKRDALADWTPTDEQVDAIVSKGDPGDAHQWQATFVLDGDEVVLNAVSHVEDGINFDAKRMEDDVVMTVAFRREPWEDGVRKNLKQQRRHQKGEYDQILHAMDD